MSDLFDVEISLALKDFIKASCSILQEYDRKGEHPRYVTKEKVVLHEKGMSIEDVQIPSYVSLIFKVRDKLENLDEINRVVEKRLQNTVFPRPSLLRDNGKPLTDDDYVYSLKWGSIQFLFRYLDENRGVAFNESLFDKLYKEYEYYEVTKIVKFNVICPLFNFEMNTDEFKIEENYIIRKITNEEFQQIYLDDVFDSRPPFIMIHAVRFVISTTYESDEPETIKDKIIEKIDTIITTLRLYGEGDLNHGVIRQIPISWTSGYNPLIGNKRSVIWRGRTYVLNIEEFGSFSAFYSKFKESKNIKRLQIALSRFNFSYDRNRDEDKIIDLIVGFESLIVEEKERPWDRGAYVGTACSMLIGKTYDERKDIKKFLQDAFNIRNRIVHGSNYDKKKLKKIIPDLESLLRKSLILLL